MAAANILALRLDNAGGIVGKVRPDVHVDTALSALANGCTGEGPRVQYSRAA